MVAILNIAQFKKMLNMPKVASSWFFISRVSSTRICKKTSVMSQNEVELKKGSFPLYMYSVHTVGRTQRRETSKVDPRCAHPGVVKLGWTIPRNSFLNFSTHSD